MTKPSARQRQDRAKEGNLARIVVLGGGFAGLWAALGAARLRKEAGSAADGLEIVLVDANPYHSIRVRNYEADLAGTTISFGDILDPVGVRHLEARVERIDPAAGAVHLLGSERSSISFDRLVVALGSRLSRPPVPGLAAFGFDVDTFEAAERLSRHLAALETAPDTPGRKTVVVIGGGFTGIECAAEIASRPGSWRVVLVDRGPTIGSGYGADGRRAIGDALSALGVETRTGTAVSAVSAEGVSLDPVGFVPAATVVCCAGMRASARTADFEVPLDPLGRLPVDRFLRVGEVPGAFAAGDCAAMPVDAGHVAVMSCQYGRPMGRFAGHNAAADLLGRPLLPLEIGWYVTVLDLGRWGALYTTGWDRDVLVAGPEAKPVKQTINRVRIYPPVAGGPDALLAAAAPVVQAPPPEVARHAS